MKKFKEGDIFYNVIKTYPKVKLFANSGQAHYGKQNHPAGSSRISFEGVGLNELIGPLVLQPESSAEIDNGILAESGDFLITENEDYIVLEG